MIFKSSLNLAISQTDLYRVKHFRFAPGVRPITLGEVIFMLREDVQINAFVWKMLCLQACLILLMRRK